MMTGIILLFVSLILLQTRYDQLSNNYSQLQDEVNQLKNRTEEKSCPDGWTGFGRSCYFKSKEEKTWTDRFWAAGLTQYENYWYPASCCNQQGKWTQRYYETKNWICEKKMI
ncbi:uncharacterized protein LOC144537519 [Sander vitreus]